MLPVRIWATQLDAQFLISFAAINQRDRPDRNQQVLLMRNIYPRAERVIGWLGPDENNGSQVLKAFETLLGMQYVILITLSGFEECQSSLR